MPRLVPARCPRCERPFDPAAIVHTPDGLAEAGCVCGDVSRVFLDDERAPTRSETASLPASWVERPRIGGWLATYGKKRPGYLTILVTIPFVLLSSVRLTLYAAHLLGAAGFFLGPLVVLAAFAWGYRRIARRRVGTYRFADGRFTTARGGVALDLPLGEIRRFGVVRSRSEPDTSFAVAVVRENALPHLLPLPGSSEAEAELVAARLNEVLAAEGRVDVGGYRGEQLRVVDDAELLEEELSSSSRRTPPPRQRRA